MNFERVLGEFEGMKLMAKGFLGARGEVRLAPYLFSLTLRVTKQKLFTKLIINLTFWLLDLRQTFDKLINKARLINLRYLRSRFILYSKVSSFRISRIELLTIFCFV